MLLDPGFHCRSPPDTHPCTLNPPLKNRSRLTHLRRLEAAPSTKCTYQADVNPYLAFYAKHGISSLPASQLTLWYFCPSLGYTVSYATYHQSLLGRHLPLHIENHSWTQLLKCPYSVTFANAFVDAKEIKRLSDNPSSSLCCMLLSHNYPQDSSLHSHDKLLHWATFTLIFYGFLCASEYTSPFNHHYAKGELSYIRTSYWTTNQWKST